MRLTLADAPAQGQAEAPGRVVTPCAAPGADPDWWFPVSGDRLSALRAQRLCALCPVRASCLTGAADRKEAAGIWGGVNFGLMSWPRACLRCGAEVSARMTYCAGCASVVRLARMRAYDRRRRQERAS